MRSIWIFAFYRDGDLNRGGAKPTPYLDIQCPSLIKILLNNNSFYKRIYCCDNFISINKSIGNIHLIICGKYFFAAFANYCNDISDTSIYISAIYGYYVHRYSSDNFTFFAFYQYLSFMRQSAVKSMPISDRYYRYRGISIYFFS